MKRRSYYSIMPLLIAVLFTFSACDNIKDNSLGVNDLDVELAEDDAIAEDVYNTVDAMVDDEVSSLDDNGYSTSTMLKSGGKHKDPYTCKVVTVDTPNDSTRFPKTITIDYGEGCTVVINGEEYTRKGIIEIVITDRWFIEGATRTTTFTDFYINDVKIEGTQTATNEGLNADSNLVFTNILTDGKIIFGNSLEYTRTSESAREWVRAADPIDDIWYITGTRSGVTVDGIEYSHEIVERLMMIRCEEFRYRWLIVQGVVEITRDGVTATIDYGDGTCDDTAILTVDGEEIEIKVRNRYHNRRRHFRKGN
jgi:hypothetical protein